MINERKKWLRRTLKEFNERWGFDIEISKIKHWNEDGAEYQKANDLQGVITLNLKRPKNQILECWFHEIAHALIHQYGVSRRSRIIFHKYNPRIGQQTFDRLAQDPSVEPLLGFVSVYSEVSETEDFCECLSAFIVNCGRLSGKINYDDYTHDLDQDPKLRKKLMAVKKILENL